MKFPTITEAEIRKSITIEVRLPRFFGMRLRWRVARLLLKLARLLCPYELFLTTSETHAVGVAGASIDRGFLVGVDEHGRVVRADEGSYTVKRREQIW